MKWRAAALPAALVLSIHQAGAPCECPQLRQFPAGVVDARADTAYVATPGNGVTALVLKTGRAIWAVKSASLPVALTDTAVVAFRRGDNPRETELVTLNRRDGTVLTVSRPFRVGVDPLDSRLLTSTVFARLDPADGMAVQWTTLGTRPAGAARLTEPESGGVIRVGSAGSVEIRPADASRAPASPGQTTPYRRGAAWVAGPWVVGACTRDLVLSSRGSSLAVSLLCDSPSVPGAERPLTESSSMALTVSIDGCHVFLEGALDRERFAWKVYSALTSDAVANIPKEPQAWNPAVVGGRAYYLSDSAGSNGALKTVLKSVDVATGRVAWQAAVRSGASQKNSLPPQIKR